MKSAPLPATPDLMTLLCIIGGIMRGVGLAERGLAMQLLVIGVLVPQFGVLLNIWLQMEERHAESGLCADGDGDDSYDDDDEDDCDESGWVRQEGPVWLWRQVTRVGAVLVPVRWFARYRNAETLPWGRVRAPAGSAPVPGRALFFKLGWDATSNCAHFITIS